MATLVSRDTFASALQLCLHHLLLFHLVVLVHLHLALVSNQPCAASQRNQQTLAR